MKSSILMLFLLFLSIFMFSQEKKIALVIGNADYQNGSGLKNPVNDANLMAQTLEDLDFEVELVTNATLKEMQNARTNFNRKISNYDVALFYYAGHGVEVEGTNYLIPIDAELSNPDKTQDEAFNVSDISNAFAKNSDNMNIMILDACRDNPFISWDRGNSRGFKAVSSQGSGTIIAFATKEGATASDGNGTNGLFTEKLVNQMKKPQSILEVFQQTRIDVLDASGGKQCPQEWNMLTDNFYFVGSKGDNTNSLEFDYWKMTEDRNNLQAYQNYINKYPEGFYLSDAKRKIEQFIWENTKEENTIEAYQRFIEDFPSGMNTHKATNMIDSLCWNKAVVENTVESYNNYLSMVMKGKKEAIAKRLIDDYSWAEAENKNTIEAYDEYCKITWATRYSTAISRIDEMSWNKALSVHTVAEYRAYIDKCPTGNHVSIAKQNIEDLIWNEKSAQNTISAYESYLNQYPTGKYKSQAKSKISDIEEEDYYQKQKSIGTLSAYKSYLHRYPGGKFANECKSRINELDDNLFSRAKSNNNLDLFLEYIRDYPNGLHITEVNDLTQDCYLDKINSYGKSKNFDRGISLCGEYTSKYPNGKYYSKITNKQKRFAEYKHLSSGYVQVHTINYHGADMPYRATYYSPKFSKPTFYMAVGSDFKFKQIFAEDYYLLDNASSISSYNEFDSTRMYIDGGVSFKIAYPVWTYIGVGGSLIKHSEFFDLDGEDKWVSYRILPNLVFDTGIYAYLGGFVLNIGIINFGYYNINPSFYFGIGFDIY